MAASLAASFPGPVRVRYHLHPPVLRALGWRKKIALGAWIQPGLRALAALRGLRGTPLDPFGWMALRRLERGLIGEYRAMVERALADLSPETHERAVKVARLPDLVRGYEQVKLRSVERFRQEARALGVSG
jgi:indolepyruvate ferredoxin oxidoreductase